MLSQEVIEESIESENNQELNSSQVIETETQLTFGTPEETEEISVSSIGFLDMLRIFFILAIIIAIAYCIIWVLKRIQNKSLVNSESIEVLSTQSLQQGNMLYIVKTGTSYFLLGATSQSISTIKEFSKKEEKDELLLSLSVNEAQSSTETKTFFSILKGAFTRIIKNDKSQKKIKKDTYSDANGSVANALDSLQKNAKRGETLNGK